MNKKIVFALSIITLLLLFSLIVKLRILNSLIKDYKQVISRQSQIINNERIYYEILYDRFKKSYLYSNINLKNIEFSVNKDINTPALVLRFPELACNTCMDSLIFNLSNNFQSKYLNSTILLVDNTNGLYLNQLKRIHGYTFPNIIENNLSNIVLKLDNYKIPYMFILDENFTIRSVFVPEKDKPNETKDYIDIMKKKYFNSL